MPQLSLNTRLAVGQEDGSGLIELFNLNRLVQTINSIAVEAKDEEEMLQLSINALSIFTGFPLGHIYLRDAVHQTTFRCSGIHYIKYFELHGESHKQLSSNVYNESSLLIEQLTAQLTPYIDREFKLVTTNETEISFRVLIPVVSRGKLFGFFELTALRGDEIPNQLLMQVFHQIGYRIGSVLDSLVTSAELEIAHNKSEALLSSIGDAVFAIDKEQNVVHLNRRGEELSGYKSSEILGKPYYDFLKFIKEKDGSENIEFIKTALGGKLTSMKDHTQIIRKGGRKLHVADTAAPLKDKDGNIIGAIVIFRDATQERKIEQMREEMISLTSHQLKAPLTVIKGNIELLKSGKLSTEERGLANEVEQIAQSMTRLVGDLLNVSKIEQGRIDFKLEPIQIEILIDEIIKRLASVAKNREVNVEFKKSKQLLPKVSADPEYLREALQNIISNAIDYTKNKVVIELKKQDDDLLIICNDNGIGIPKDEQSKIFEKFYRTSNAKQTKTGGTGLGLNIAKAIIEKFYGKIWFESEENKGTTFYISLPFL